MAKEKKDPEKKVKTTRKSVIKKDAPEEKNIVKKLTTQKKETAKKEVTKKVDTKTKKTVEVPAKKASTTSKKNLATTKPSKITKSKTIKTQKTKAVLKFQPEYYDLPYAYNKTVVKVLAQTPKVLFVYWEISETDRKNFQKTYGEKFFEETKPILVVHNITMNYSFEIEINDFANSWYIHINDSKCNYTVELGRRPLPFANSSVIEETNNHKYIPYYVYITSSNKMESPNNHVLFNFARDFIQYRNVKTGQIINKDAKQFKFITNFGIVTVEELYRILYPGEDLNQDSLFKNPKFGFSSSGGLSSSGTFSSQFK